jgi:hypothetical protein
MLAVLVVQGLLFAGCVTYSPVLEPSSTPRKGMAYLAGIFTEPGSSKGGNYHGISYEHVESAELHTFRFQQGGERDVQALEIPPGTYRIDGWFMADVTDGPLARSKPTGPLFSRRFTVAADQVHFLGEYWAHGSAIYSSNRRLYSVRLHPLRVHAEQRDVEAFAARYPNLAKLPMRAAYD